jgi:hypothetical protein
MTDINEPFQLTQREVAELERNRKRCMKVVRAKLNKAVWEALDDVRQWLPTYSLDGELGPELIDYFKQAIKEWERA